MSRYYIYMMFISLTETIVPLPTGINRVRSCLMLPICSLLIVCATFPATAHAKLRHRPQIDR